MTFDIWKVSKVCDPPFWLYINITVFIMPGLFNYIIVFFKSSCALVFIKNVNLFDDLFTGARSQQLASENSQTKLINSWWTKFIFFFTFYLFRSFHLDIHHNREENMFTVSFSCWRNQIVWLKFDLIFHEVAVDKCSLLKQMTQTIIHFHVFIEHAEWNNECLLIYNSFHCRCGCASSWWEVHHHLCVLPLRRYAPYPRRPGRRQSQCEFFPHHFKMTQLPLNNPVPDLGSQHIVQLICRRTKSNKTNEAFLWMRFLKVSCLWEFPHYFWIASVSSLSDNDKMIVMYSETHSRPHDFISFVQHKKRCLGECSCCSFQYSYSEWGLKVRSHLLLLWQNPVGICTIWSFVWIRRSSPSRVCSHSSCLHKFTVFTNRKMHGLKVACARCASYISMQLTVDNGPFCLQTFAEILLLLHCGALKIVHMTIFQVV